MASPIISMVPYYLCLSDDDDDEKSYIVFHLKSHVIYRWSMSIHTTLYLYIYFKKCTLCYLLYGSSRSKLQNFNPEVRRLVNHTIIMMISGGTSSINNTNPLLIIKLIPFCIYNIKKRIFIYVVILKYYYYSLSTAAFNLQRSFDSE